MATEILDCDNQEVSKPTWDNVVGEKTLASGGYVGDLLTIVRVHLEDAKEKGELTEAGAGEAYAGAILESMKDAITFELGYPKAQLELCYLQAQIDKLKCDCDNQTRDTDSKIALAEEQIIKMKCECANDTDLADSKIALNAAQENKLACDCCNSSKVSAAQAELYDRQAKGFDDNANQKLYDSQLSAWSMVFADTEIDTVTSSIATNHISDTYNRLSERLGSTLSAPDHDYGSTP